MPTPIDFVGPAYQSRSRNLAADRLINLYVELNETGQARRAALYGTPGLRRLTTVPASPCRGLYTTSTGRVFGVWGTQLFEISNAWTATALGSVGLSSSVVSMADNGLMLVAVDGTANGGWTYDLQANTFAAISNSAFYGATQVVCVDTYFVFNRPNTQQFYIWGPQATPATAFDATEIASVEGRADRLLGLLADHRELWLFGQQSTEVYFNSGNADFPFDRIQGAYIEHGCAAPHSVAKLDNTVYWLGSDDKGQGMIWKAAGYTPQRISTHAVEYALSTYPTLADAEAYTCQIDGHSFYFLSLDAGNATWGYDASTQLWFQMATLDPTTGTLGRHRARGYCFGFGKHLVGDDTNGKLYELSPTTYTEDGAEIVRLRAAPHISQAQYRVYQHSLQLDLEAGTGLDAGVSPGTTPQLALRWSDDGGFSFSNEYWTTAGALGAYRTRAIWRRLGMARDRVFEVRSSEPIKHVWLAAYLEATAGRS